MLSGNKALAEQVVSEMTSNPLTTFVTLLIKELAKENEPEPPPADKDKDKGQPRKFQDVVVDDTQCKR